MTLYQALDRIDAIHPNTFSKTEKVSWISQLEWTLKEEIYDTHEVPPFVFNGYTDETDGNTVLSVPEPFTELYIYYVSAMIDFYNRETTAYNNNMAMYNALFSQYWSWFNRNYRPKSKRFRFFTTKHSEMRHHLGYRKEKRDNVQRAYDAGFAAGQLSDAELEALDLDLKWLYDALRERRIADDQWKQEFQEFLDQRGEQP